MKSGATASAVFYLGPYPPLCAAAQNGGLLPGADEVDAHLEESLASIDRPERCRVCLTDGAAKPAHGLFIPTPDTLTRHAKLLPSGASGLGLELR